MARLSVIPCPLCNKLWLSRSSLLTSAIPQPSPSRYLLQHLPKPRTSLEPYPQSGIPIFRTLILDPKPSICSLCFPLNPWRARGQDHYVDMSVVMFCPSAFVMYGDMRLEIKIGVERMSGPDLATAATAKAKLEVGRTQSVDSSTSSSLIPSHHRHRASTISLANVQSVSGNSTEH